MVTAPEKEPGGGKLRAELSTSKIVFFVIAASSPLAAMAGALPLAFQLGAGPQTPAMFLAAGVVLLFFSVGYAAMSRHITNAGGLYSYIGAGLGRTCAVAAGLVAVVSYGALAIMLVGTLSYFSRILFLDSGVDVPWGVFAASALAATAWLGYRRIDLSAKMLGVLIGVELLMLVLLDGAVLGSRGLHALPREAFDVSRVDHSGLALGLMFAFTAFLGFEAAALYGEESRDPKRTVPRATYAAVVVIMIFYGFTSWISVGAIGVDSVRPRASDELGDLFFDVATERIGTGFSDLMFLLLLTSLFASLVACHNSLNRVLFALGRERVLPARLGTAHSRHGSPSRASAAQSVVVTAVIVVLGLAGLDPYLDIGVTMSALGTLGIVLLQATTALAVIGYFRRHAGGHWWRTALAPALAALGLYTAVVLITVNFSKLTGLDSPLVNGLPVVLAAVVAGGVCYGLWLRTKRPDLYAAIAGNRLPDSGEPADVELQNR
ncbi:APC family permease [Streptomyces brevispora]|uniref:APC family permease n=1 Tax=Streptomyces brevispora TaxID=887462 RepID=UPI002E325B0B|nr:APC family permease [Streptomyces brevispora]